MFTLTGQTIVKNQKGQISATIQFVSSMPEEKKIEKSFTSRSQW